MGTNAHLYNELATGTKPGNPLDNSRNSIWIIGDTEFYRYDFPSLLEVLLQFHPNQPKAASVGCSTGEEAYSLILSGWKPGLTVVGYDTNQERLATARTGEYKIYQDKFYRRADIPDKEIFKSSLARLCSVGGDFTVNDVEEDRYVVTIGKQAKSRARFLEHDILSGPLPEKYQMIFIMNLLMYFSEQGANTALWNLWESLEPNGLVVPSYGYEQRAQLNPQSFGFIELPIRPEPTIPSQETTYLVLLKPAKQ
ncbi:hypothetical protein HY640_03240 [Candidatus Woesearchaeota archaeon]|nr:hypothetical protein [Candidatus Woesearchaeota archaeon]